MQWTASASKHGITQTDAFYAMSHSTWREKVTKASGEVEITVVGPAHAQTDRPLEVVFAFTRSGDTMIYHVMELGPQIRKRMENSL